MEIKLYNTRSRAKETFTPAGEKVLLYTCGPTVYNFAHIGNLRTFLFEDILKRVLLFNGLKVNHVMNITDVGHLVSDGDTGDDKMEQGAAREGKTVWDIAEYYADAVMKDFKKLNVLPADTFCKATDNIDVQIALVQTLEEKGYAYQIEDGVYFDTKKFSGYGDFARLDLNALLAGARVGMVEGKRNGTDFALWKSSPKNQKRQMEWESPWGMGFPGWHVECSAMAMKFLGETLDIHCGGIDHIPVHHTNEVAQSECATGKPFARFWLHGEFLILEKEKMAKSTGNFVALSTLEEKGFTPAVFRYFCLSAHYRQKLSFDWTILENAKIGFDKLKSKIEDLRSKGGESEEKNVGPSRQAFLKEINDDLNMPRALAVMWKVLRDEKMPPADRVSLVESFDQVFGIGINLMRGGFVEIPADARALLVKRNAARESKDWKKADEIRDILSGRGFKIIDTPTGTKLQRS